MASPKREQGRPLLALRAIEEMEEFVAVRIRMKMMGRKHRPYFRIVAIDHRQPRDGRIIEELGSYDPMVRNTDERVKLKPDRLKYWMSVGAIPSERVATLLNACAHAGHRSCAAWLRMSTA